MGTWALFSTYYCEHKSSCVLVDAWLQLALCILAVLVLVALCCVATGCCRHARCRRSSDSGDETYSEGSMVRRVLGRAHASKASGRRIWTHLRSRTSPLPLSVIKKDARLAHIMSHKNSHKHGALFIKQTQRMSRMDFATVRARGDAAQSLDSEQSVHDSNVIEPFRGPSEVETATHDGSIKIGKRRPGSRLGRGDGARKASSVAPVLVRHVSRSAGPSDDDAQAAPQSPSGDHPGRSNSFRKRLATAFAPSEFFSKRSAAPLVRQHSHTSFDVPSYETKLGLTELSPDDRLENERRSSMELRDKRRLSVGSSSQLQFQVGGDKASVYEVKLKEINLVKRLAFGPLSEVYAAIWRDTKVGVKLLMPREGVVDHLAEAVKNFRREIWVMSSLKHPNILKLIGASLTPSCYVLVMEYMPNGSLYEYLRDEANFFPEQMITTCAYDIAAGMSYIHQCGILQRDLKSKNCLLSENLVVKVADFGLARYKSKLYGQYTFVGTPFWAAPEVIRHEEYDEKADVYSYAIVLWELVERKDPYENLNAYQVPLLVANDSLRPAEFTNPAPLGLEQLMKQCWDSDPEQRPTFTELAETLQKWLRPNDAGTDDLSMHIQREQTTATEEELHCFASSHDVNEKVIPILLSSRMQSKRSLLRKPSFTRGGSDRSIAAATE